MVAESIIADACAGYNVSICARAGAGKTSTILAVAKALAGKTIEILTYNRALANECTAKLKSEKIEGNCSTIHSKYSKCCGKVCNDDFCLLEHEDVQRFEADVVMIDEVQDLRPLLFEALMKMIPYDRQIIIVGDELQILYDYCSGDEATEFVLKQPEIAFSDVSKNEWKKHELVGSFRLTESCAAFVNCIWNSKIQSLSREKDSPVDVVITSPWSKGVTQLIRKTIDHYGPSNTMLLAQTLQGNGALRTHVNRLLKDKYEFHIKEFFRGFDNSEDYRNKVRVWSFCSSKGCEADVVIVFGLDMCPAGNDLGVACSRAKKKMIVIQNERSVFNEIFQSIPYHLQFKQLNCFGDQTCYDGDVTFGKIEQRQHQNDRFAVSDRINISPRLLFSLFRGFQFETKTVHDGTRLNTSIKLGDDDVSEDVSALYGKQMEYLLQAHSGHLCADAKIMQFNGAQITHIERITEFFDRNSITHTGLENVSLPMSTTSFRRKCNTGEIKISRHGEHVHLVCDSCDEVHAIHAELQKTKSAVEAMKLANHVLAVDSYEDRKTMIKSYDWVDSSVMQMVRNVLDTMPCLQNGEFEHCMQYVQEMQSGVKVVINGKVDWMHEDTVVDFKMTSEIASDHKLQIITYTALHSFFTSHTACGILYYVRLGTTLTVTISYKNAVDFLQKYVHMRVFGKFEETS